MGTNKESLTASIIIAGESLHGEAGRVPRKNNINGTVVSHSNCNADPDGVAWLDTPLNLNHEWRSRRSGTSDRSCGSSTRVR